jgi:mono/diheme cytochrome c family protein
MRQKRLAWLAQCAKRRSSRLHCLRSAMKKFALILQTVFATLGLLLVLGLLGTAAFVYAGVYDVAATKHHAGITYHLLHYAMLRSVSTRADDIPVPPLDDPRRVQNGMMLYGEHCAQCHGAPGVAPAPFAFGLRPAPVNLVEPGRNWSPQQIYWVVKHGVKMTAMPGWQYRLSEDELWDLAAFVKHMPALSPVDYKAQQAAMEAVRSKPVVAAAQGQSHDDRKAGLHAIYQYLCVTCHAIPGTVEGKPNVGPPLDSVASRRYLGGVLVNTPDNMVRWLMNPQAIDPRSGMPNLHVREQDARDIAAYLYSLDQPP